MNIGLEHTALEELRLLRCSTANDSSVASVLKCVPSLLILDFTSTSTISDNALSQVARYSKKLRELYLFGCYGITDHAAAKVARSCTNLGKCDLVTFESEEISLNFPVDLPVLLIFFFL